MIKAYPLPDEIWILIIMFLKNDPRTLGRLARTNKMMAILLEDNLIWRSLCNEQKFSPLKLVKIQKGPELYSTNYSASSLPQSAEDSKSNPRESRIPRNTWKEIFAENYQTILNWREGKYTVSRVERRVNHTHIQRQPHPNSTNNLMMCLDFNEKYAVSFNINNQNRYARIWDLTTGLEIFQIHTTPNPTCVRFMNNDLVLTGNNDSVTVTRLKTGELVRVFIGHEGEIGVINYHGQYVCSGSEDYTVRIWDISSGECLHLFNGHTDAICCLQVWKYTLIFR